MITAKSTNTGAGQSDQGEVRPWGSLTIADLMTCSPHGIHPDESARTARKRMQEFHIRHLPVRNGGRIVGIVSDRDIDVLMNSGGVNLDALPIGDIMLPNPFTVGPEVKASGVVFEMAARRIGSAVVVDTEGRVVGIFTNTDALEVLAKIMTDDLNTPAKESAGQRRKEKES